uniref:Uncharacterized protein n=1 Tax=Anguilla anguilla TaxID=7936 RepID=A0A0E9WLY6_ANGAN
MLKDKDSNKQCHLRQSTSVDFQPEIVDLFKDCINAVVEFSN